MMMDRLKVVSRRGDYDQFIAYGVCQILPRNLRQIIDVSLQAKSTVTLQATGIIFKQAVISNWVLLS